MVVFWLVLQNACVDCIPKTSSIKTNWTCFVCSGFVLHRSFSSHSRSESTDSLSVKKRCSVFDMDATESPAIDFSLGQKLYEFYRAPITKFWSNVVRILSKSVNKDFSHHFDWATRRLPWAGSFSVLILLFSCLVADRLLYFSDSILLRHSSSSSCDPSSPWNNPHYFCVHTVYRGGQAG